MPKTLDLPLWRDARLPKQDSIAENIVLSKKKIGGMNERELQKVCIWRRFLFSCFVAFYSTAIFSFTMFKTNKK